ncbi:hypothetical protein Tco_1060686, partial [Tanacetum coccineum]
VVTGGYGCDGDVAAGWGDDVDVVIVVVAVGSTEFGRSGGDDVGF